MVSSSRVLLVCGWLCQSDCRLKSFRTRFSKGLGNTTAALRLYPASLIPWRLCSCVTVCLFSGAFSSSLGSSGDDQRSWW